MSVRQPLSAIHQVIDNATQAQAVVILQDIANFDFPAGCTVLAADKARAAAMATALNANASLLITSKLWLQKFVMGYPACEYASFWVK
jgi:hypothetical protein